MLDVGVEPMHEGLQGRRARPRHSRALTQEEQGPVRRPRTRPALRLTCNCRQRKAVGRNDLIANEGRRSWSRGPAAADEQYNCEHGHATKFMFL